MDARLAQVLQAYIEPPACRVRDVAVSFAYRNGTDKELHAGILRQAGQSASHSIHVDSRYSVQSITKSLTAAAVLRLVHSGLLTLDSPLARWLPDVPHAARITLRQCLQHTSGLPDYGAVPEYHQAVNAQAAPWSFAEFLERTHAERLLFEPGQGWRYSNIGYMVVRRLVETVCGESFAEIISKKVCQPLGLQHTFVIGDREGFQALVPAYSVSMSPDGLPVDVRSRYDPGWVATGVVASTASDLVRFFDKLLAGDLLPGVLLEEMRRVVHVGTPSSQRWVMPSYGLGLMADPQSPYGILYGHNGGGPGYTSTALHVLTPAGQSVTVAVLSNTENFYEVELMAFTLIDQLTRGRLKT
ncbi:Metal-dependent hydrolase, beta-lactamase superfamily [Nitrospira japonica]|uniref:Metal-dependent hydrolase, beta-lactamase superfamily n=1 Tax=Nitrospira japonica TaxID=1325564 RepID=A0A1W1I9W9_9BACT|nr:serine hydrolase domain-containing protein [Nitrospira japonica]SLM49847.1 Metal-dependent hydrolase, beta-lactamase superfamily [Nitrospira japonica]